MGRIILGLILVILGGAMTIYGNALNDSLGPIAWAEEHLGSEGGSRLMYKLIGVGLSIVGFMIMTNLMSTLILGLIKIIFPGFVTPVKGA